MWGKLGAAGSQGRPVCNRGGTMQTASSPWDPTRAEPSHGGLDSGTTTTAEPRGVISKINEKEPNDRAGANRDQWRPPPPSTSMTKKTHDVRKYLRPFIFDAPPLHRPARQIFFLPRSSSNHIQSRCRSADLARRIYAAGAIHRAKSGNVVTGTS